ncbi:sugar kinase [Lentzea sp. BCCO 10_0798]|jgi:2-dehydro-3-deoxygluconokinase|uniref:Sugar kinase n=1 Tax=Lentzea kristufekii TaxID=3095430 RepID=A0ABU4THW1_9PSEU|nr:sugar kinase [Lentzea sp. BCCO 10_0798]MDX8047790.1 sugar kinase [Lentzea sp. BCCO 10_0798]
MRFDHVGGVVCLGETMVMMVPAEPGPVHLVRTWHRAVGGAESNVAVHLTRLGVRSSWVSAVGDDSFGLAVLDAVGGFGVDVSRVRVDPARPTGLYVKEASPHGSPVRYYRRGSAASGMGLEMIDRLGLGEVKLVHLSGITAALSDSCLAMMRELLRRPRHGFLISFDLNWRPALWTDRDPRVLRELADMADVVLAGSDEAELVWGTGDPARLRRLLPGPASLVVKQGADGATLLEGGSSYFEPALEVDVVEPVGAGDAFAAGFLAATLAGESPSVRLRAGHLQAASALLTAEDVGDPLPDDVTVPLLHADPQTWASARLEV